MSKEVKENDVSSTMFNLKLIDTIYETGEWPKDFTEVTMIALKKEDTSYKMQ